MKINRKLFLGIIFTILGFFGMWYSSKIYYVGPGYDYFGLVYFMITFGLVGFGMSSVIEHYYPIPFSDNFYEVYVRGFARYSIVFVLGGLIGVVIMTLGNLSEGFLSFWLLLYLFGEILSFFWSDVYKHLAS